MAIAVVTATEIVSTTGTSASASVSASAGNALIVGGGAYMAGGGGSTWTVARTGDTYTTDSNTLDTVDGANHFVVGIASAPNVAGGAVSLSVTVSSGGNSGATAYAMEVSGLATSSMRDGTSPALLTGTSTTPSSNSLSNTTANAIFVAVNSDLQGNGATETPTSPWSTTAGAVTMTELNGNTRQVMGMEYQIVSSVAGKSGGWTIGSSGWGDAIAVYKAAASAGNTASISDNINVSESVTATKVNNTGTLFDSITIAETITPRLTDAVNVFDSATTSESITPSLVSNDAVSDNINVSESTTAFLPTLTAQSVDNITVSESPVPQLVSNANLTDNITVAEFTSGGIPITSSVFDSVTISETTTPQLVNNPSVIDNIQVSESIISQVPNLFLSTTDNVTVSETITATLPSSAIVSASVFDLITVSEDVAILKTGLATVKQNPIRYMPSRIFGRMH